MRHSLTKSALALESVNYRGTHGVSENNRCAGFQPAFIDRQSATVHLSRFPDGRRAPCHLLDGLPDALVITRDERGRVTRVKGSVVSGFVHGGWFYTRDEALAMLVSASGFDVSQDADASLRRAA
jgi:hypothetical protein